jgi:hypothetical protein
MKSRIPNTPLRFGTKNDFDLALNELRWIRSINGKLEESDYEIVSSKYLFPKEFLKHGLKGLSQNDFIIMKSKWFPIIYGWWKHWDEMQTEYLKRIIWFSRSLFVFYFVLVVIVTTYLYLIFLFLRFDLGPINLIGIGISLALFGVSFLYHLHGGKGQLEEKMVEQEDKIRKEGMEQMIESVNDFITKSKILRVAVVSPKKALKFLSSNIVKLSGVNLGRMEIIREGKSFEIPVSFLEKPVKSHAERWKKILNSNKSK